LVAWSVFTRTLTHRSALVRLAAAAAVGAVGLTVAWAGAYALLPEGALRFTLGFLPALDARAHAPGVATTLFVWNVSFGFGVIALASLFSVGPISLAYLAPWTRHELVRPFRPRRADRSARPAGCLHARGRA